MISSGRQAPDDFRNQKEVLLDTGKWKRIDKLESRVGVFDVISVETSIQNLFVNGILVHNAKK